MSQIPTEAPIAISVVVNGRTRTATVNPRLTLADFLREQVALASVHLGCEHGICGACTVLLDGATVRSCLLLAVQADGAQVVTVEGLSPGDGALSPLQESFRQHHALQCGYCTPGMVVTAHELLERHPNPDEATIREYLSGNLCRCTGYISIIRAVQAAAQQKADTAK